MLAVKAMFAALALAFVLVLLRSLSGPSSVSNPAAVFDDVQTNQTALRRYQGQRVWATRLGALQRNQLKQLDAVVSDPNAGCELSVTICAVKASTARDGIEIIFSDARPPQLDSNVPWFGGLVDPTNGAVYDRLGRLYRATGRNMGNSLSLVPIEPPGLKN